MRGGHRGGPRGPRGGHRPRVHISSGRHYRGGYGRSRGRGLFRIIVSALFFTAILKLAQSNPDKARSSCAKIKKVGIVITLLALIVFGIGLLAMMMQSQSIVPFFMLIGGIFVLPFGITMISEASYVSYQCGSNQNMNSDNSMDYNSNNSQPINNEVICPYCHGTNTSRDKNCASCGAQL